MALKMELPLGISKGKNKRKTGTGRNKQKIEVHSADKCYHGSNLEHFNKHIAWNLKYKSNCSIKQKLKAES